MKSQHIQSVADALAQLRPHAIALLSEGCRNPDRQEVSAILQGRPGTVTFGLGAAPRRGVDTADRQAAAAWWAAADAQRVAPLAGYLCDLLYECDRELASVVPSAVLRRVGFRIRPGDRSVARIETEVDFIDDDLRAMPDWVHILKPGTLRRFGGYAERQARRAAARDAARRNSATGSIEAVALASIADLGLDQADILRSLGTSRSHGLDRSTWPGGVSQLQYRWKDGTVGLVFHLDNVGTWQGTSLAMWSGTIPEVTVLAMIGRPLSALVRHPLLSADAIIASVEQDDATKCFTFKTVPSLHWFDAASGRTWPRGQSD